MEFRIRPASVHDSDGLREVHRASPEAGPANDVEWYRALIDTPGTPRAGTWVAEADGRVVGFAHFRDPGEPDTADLTLLCVEPDARGKGVARPLLDGALDDMRTLEFRSVRVEVPDDLPRAARFFERAGFRWAESGDYRLGL